MKVAILYAAKSTLDPKGSIPTQLEDGRRLAAERGYEVDSEHIEENASAYKGNRGPGLEAALARCEELRRQGEEVVLIVQHSDRIARGDGKDARHLIEVVLWALKNDVELLWVQDPEILAGGDLALLLGAIGGMRNHQNSKRKSLAVKDGLRRRVRDRGLPTGGRPAYGYRWVAGELVIVEHEAVIVRRIFAEYLAGWGQCRITGGLNDDHIPSAKGGKWHQGTVSGILWNCLYAGRVKLGDEEFDGEHEAIIDPGEWEKARQLREANWRAPGKGVGRRPAAPFLFVKGHLRCGRCGEAMKPTGRGSYQVYECYGRARRASGCSQMPVKRALIDTAVLGFFERVALDVDGTRIAIERPTTSG